jgi:hypothetical protein
VVSILMTSHWPSSRVNLRSIILAQWTEHETGCTNLSSVVERRHQDCPLIRHERG